MSVLRSLNTRSGRHQGGDPTPQSHKILAIFIEKKTQNPGMSAQSQIETQTCLGTYETGGTGEVTDVGALTREYVFAVSA